mmetsp:Transcript_43703/g.83414  ORF Transcript_43703/g.83414 Transcript_43703/m.83414 type:complete len:273 (+) Transcript_43703:1116-1934(+)
MCSLHAERNCCTFRTLPEPQYAHDSSTSCAYMATFGFSVLMISTVASTAACFFRKSSPRPRKASRPSGFSRSASGRANSAWHMASVHPGCAVPTNTSPSVSAAKPKTSALLASSHTSGHRSSATSSLAVPAYAKPRPWMAPMRTAAFSLDTLSYRSAYAGSHSFRTQVFSTPTDSKAPATTWLSVEYRYLSICGRPPSTSHISTMPRLAVALILPCSLFLKIHDTSVELSGAAVMSLSWPKPALTNALTKVVARLWRAESVAVLEGVRPSTR